MRRLPLIAPLLALVIFAALAGSAGAATFCVSDPACVSAGGIDGGSDLQAALNAAIAGLGPDTVKIGPGTFSAANGFTARDGASAIAVVGAGRGVTTLTATTAGRTVLDFGASRDATVSDLSVAMPPSGGVGVFVPQHIARVAISGGTGSATGLWSQNTTVDDVSILLPLDGSSNQGIYRPNGTLRADGLTITAHNAITGFGSSDSYEHLRIQSNGTGITFTSSLSNTLTLDDAQIRMSGAGDGVVFSAQSSSPAFLQAHFLTVVGDGTRNSAGVVSSGGGAATSTSVTLEDSIVAGFDHALACFDGAGPARLTVRYAAFDPSDLVDSCATRIDARTGNLGSEPGLVADANGDLRLPAGSPAIDAGDPTLLTPSPTTDLAGAARIFDGNGDGTARVDMGAFEWAPAPPPPPGGGSGGGNNPPPVALAVTHFRISPRRFAPAPLGARTGARRAGRRPHRGATFRFHLSRAARVTIRISLVKRARRGRRVVLVLRRVLPGGVLRAGDHRLRFDGRDGRGHPLAPGRYRATIGARDGADRASARAIGFTIVAL